MSDPDWHAQVAARLADECAPLDEVRAHLLAAADPAWLLKERVAEDLFAYLVVERELLPDELGEGAGGVGGDPRLDRLPPGPQDLRRPEAAHQERGGARGRPPHRGRARSSPRATRSSTPTCCWPRTTAGARATANWPTRAGRRRRSRRSPSGASRRARRILRRVPAAVTGALAGAGATTARGPGARSSARAVRLRRGRSRCSAAPACDGRRVPQRRQPSDTPAPRPAAASTTFEYGRDVVRHLGASCRRARSRRARTTVFQIGAAQGGEAEEDRQRHALDAGRYGDQAAEDRDHPAEEHRLGAVPQEPRLGPVDVGDLDQRQPCRRSRPSGPGRAARRPRTARARRPPNRPWSTAARRAGSSARCSRRTRRAAGSPRWAAAGTGSPARWRAPAPGAPRASMRPLAQPGALLAALLMPGRHARNPHARRTMRPAARS